MKITGDKGLGPLSQVQKGHAVQGKENKEAGNADKVDFSTVLQGVRRPQGGEAVQRSEKVQALKTAVADGSYQPDLKKVAAGLLRTLIRE